MIEGLPAILGLGSPVATTILLFYLVFTGRLWTLAAHNDVVRVLQDQIAAITTDRNHWRDTATLVNKTNADLAHTNSVLIETAETTKHVMSALQDTAQGGARAVPQTSH